MNNIFRKITGLGIKNEIPKRAKRKVYPYTAAFTNGVCFAVTDGVKSFQDFPGADLLNVIHRNGKTTVIRLTEKNYLKQNTTNDN